MTRVEAIQWGAQQIRTISDVSTLEAEVLLAYVLQVTRTHLHTWPEKPLTVDEQKQFADCIARRMQKEPVAYITGHCEFWSLDFLVTSHTLVPRPETELLVELVLKEIQSEHAIVADLGTGSGAIACALAHERPQWVIHASDLSQPALDVAKHNAKRLRLTNILFHQGSWLNALSEIPSKEHHFDIIVSNPPYLSETEWHERQSNLSAEPRHAFVSKEEGLQDINEIIQNAKIYLKSGGSLLLEHGFEQALAVRELFMRSDYQNVSSFKDLQGHERVTRGVVNGTQPLN